MSMLLLGLGIVLSQFYFFKSGIPQPAHYLIALAIVVFLFRRMRFIIARKGDLAPWLLASFVFYQAVVNFSFYGITKEFDFVLQMVYIFYGFLVFLLIFNLSEIEGKFIEKISFFLLLALCILFLVALLGFGGRRFYPRYNAYFNDPNQMAFWVLCISSALIFHFGKYGRLILIAVILMVAGFLIVLTASRSGLIGYAMLAFGFLIAFFKGSQRGFNFQQVLVYVVALLVVVCGAYYALNSDSDVISFLSSRVEIIDAAEQAGIRGYTRIMENPEYIILGAGHGMDDRFDEYGTEIHSTWAGILFYYGLPGILLFLAMLFSIFRKLCFSEKLIFLAPLFYSFSTFGLRTPVFWIFLGFFYSVISRQRMDLKKNAQTRPYHFPRALVGSFPRSLDPQASGHRGAGDHPCP